MRKKDLKNGMKVVQRCGDIMVVMIEPHTISLKKESQFVGGNTFSPFKSYTLDLLDTEGMSDYDIIEVWEARYFGKLITESLEGCELIWKREDIPEYTMKEAINKMGHEFKIKD